MRTARVRDDEYLSDDRWLTLTEGNVRVDRSQHLFNLSQSRLALCVHEGVEVGDVCMSQLAHHLSLASMHEAANSCLS